MSKYDFRKITEKSILCEPCDIIPDTVDLELLDTNFEILNHDGFIDLHRTLLIYKLHFSNTSVYNDKYPLYPSNSCSYMFSDDIFNVFEVVNYRTNYGDGCFNISCIVDYYGNMFFNSFDYKKYNINEDILCFYLVDSFSSLCDFLRDKKIKNIFYPTTPNDVKYLRKLMNFQKNKNKILYQELLDKMVKI